MRYKSLACPGQSIGMVYNGIKIVVPNQSMSLKEILERFSRNEELPIGKDVSFDDGDDDLEKIAHADLVDRDEYVDQLKNTQQVYKRQEAQKEKVAREKIAAEYRQKVEDELKKDAVKAPKTE